MAKVRLSQIPTPDMAPNMGPQGPGDEIIIPSRFGHPRCQLSGGSGGHHAYDAGAHVGEDGGGAGELQGYPGQQKDAGADHGSHTDGEGIPESEFAS